MYAFSQLLHTQTIIFLNFQCMLSGATHCTHHKHMQNKSYDKNSHLPQEIHGTTVSKNINMHTKTYLPTCKNISQYVYVIFDLWELLHQARSTTFQRRSIRSTTPHHVHYGRQCFLNTHSSSFECAHISGTQAQFSIWIQPSSSKCKLCIINVPYTQTYVGTECRLESLLK